MFKLRIRRKYSWLPRPFSLDTPIGERNSNYYLVCKDILEYSCKEGDWFPVPIVEEDKPKHPSEVDWDRQVEEMKEQGREFVKVMMKLKEGPNS